MSVENNTPVQSISFFIDRDEIEEMIGEYYNFEKVTEEMWIELDSEIREMCSERGVSPDYAEEYVRICDACCEKLCFPSM